MRLRPQFGIWVMKYSTLYVEIIQDMTPSMLSLQKYGSLAVHMRLQQNGVKNAKDASDDFYETTVACSIKESKIDEWLAYLPDQIVNQWEQLGTTITVHKYLMDLFKRITGLEKRALASKYLHFHRPDAFFIYDSRAKKAISMLTPGIRQISAINCNKSDEEYLNFVRRCLWLRDRIALEYNVVFTPRQIDKILLNLVDRDK